MTAPALDPREQRVLELSAAGFTYEHIARELGTGRPFVAKLASQLLRKLGATSMPQAVLVACRAGILDGQRRRHGDHAGYAAHVYRGEDPKDCRYGCHEAELAYRADRRAARQAQEGVQAPRSRPQNTSRPLANSEPLSSSQGRPERSAATAAQPSHPDAA